MKINFNAYNVKLVSESPFFFLFIPFPKNFNKKIIIYMYMETFSVNDEATGDGEWTPRRELAFIEAMIEHRPFSKFFF